MFFNVTPFLCSWTPGSQSTIR